MGACKKKPWLINTVFHLPGNSWAGACPLEENLRCGRACFFLPSASREALACRAHRVEFSLRLGLSPDAFRDKRGGQQMGRLPCPHCQISEEQLPGDQAARPRPPSAAGLM